MTATAALAAPGTQPAPTAGGGCLTAAAKRCRVVVLYRVNAARKADDAGGVVTLPGMRRVSSV